MVKNAIKVYARLKPEKNRKNVTNYQIHERRKENHDEDFIVLVTPQKIKEYLDHRPESWNFSFYRIFQETSTQEKIFTSVARPVLESVLDGYNGTIFAYGQTGSGKTYSISGDKKIYDDMGIIPRSLQYLFDVIRKHPENVYSIEVAYMEIYNENGYDLLDRKQRRDFAVTRLEDLPRITIQEDEVGKIHLKNLTFHCVGSEQDAFELLIVGDNNRVTAETPMNPMSSRSHCIFTIVVSTKQFGADHYKRAKIHLIDLAGSERVYKCAISGTILTEAKHINLSLHYLEQVIVCLGQESTGHIPYRNSLLTSILRDSLGGNCLTIMLATLNVSLFSFEETISTCRFAQRVALIKNDVKLVLEKDITSENTLLRLENERLKQQIEAFTKQSTSRELTIEEKQTLDTQIRKFVECSTTISWDYDPRKVQYCFDAFKKNFGFINNPDTCSEKLKYYKDMVIQRDKEISLLINMLKKERSKKDDLSKNNERINGNDDNSSNDLKSTWMQCVPSNANFDDDIFNMEFQDNNVKSTPQPIMNSSNHLHTNLHDNFSSNEIVLQKPFSENDDDKFMFSNILNGEEGHNVRCLKRKGKYPSRKVAQNIAEPNMKYFGTQIEKEIERNITDCNNAYANARRTGDTEMESEFKRYSSCNRNGHSLVNSMNKVTGQSNVNETLKPKATCNIINVILDEPIKSDIETNKCLQVNKILHRSFPKVRNKQDKYQHIRQILEEDSRNNTEDSANSNERRKDSEIINTVTQNTTAQSLEMKEPFRKYDLKHVCSLDIPHNYQRLMNLNVPKAIPKSTETKLSNSESTNLAGKTNSELRYYDLKGNDSMEDNVLESSSLLCTEKVNNAFIMKPRTMKSKDSHALYDDLPHNTQNCSIQEEKSTFPANLTRKKLQICNAERDSELENCNKVCFVKDKNNENGCQKEICERQSLNSVPVDTLRSFNENLHYIKTKEIVPRNTSEENQIYDEKQLRTNHIDSLNDEINSQAKRQNKTGSNFQQTIRSSHQEKFSNEFKLKKIECNSARQFHVPNKQENNESISNIKEIKTSTLLECSYESNSKIAGIKPEKEYFNENEALIENIRSFEKTLPLTGDPEIDEEIIAFYRAKRSGGIY